MNKLITDTNVWYNISTGRLDISNLTKKYILCPSTINLIEILAKMNSNNFNVRKKAFLAMKPYSNNMVCSNDKLLGKLWKKKDRFQLHFTNYFNAIEKSNNLDEFKQNLSVYKNLFMIDQLHSHQQREWDTFKKDILGIIESWKPGYQPKLPDTRYSFMKQIDIKKLDVEKNSEEYAKWCVGALFLRANGSENAKFQNRFDLSKKVLSTYIEVYRQYLLYCANSAPPEENDYADLELFLYGCLVPHFEPQNTIYIGTAENKWLTIAQKSNINNIIDLKTYEQSSPD